VDKKDLISIGCRAIAVGIASAVLAFGIIGLVDTKVNIILLSIGLFAVAILPLTAE